MTCRSDQVAVMADERLRGCLARIRYERDGFLIGVLADNTVVKGHVLEPRVGLEYVFLGRWVDDPKFGRQFAFENYEVRLPTDEEAIGAYLMESAKWIGPTIAARLIDAYGGQTLAICKDDPDRVATEIKGVSPRRAAGIASLLRANAEHEASQVALKTLLNGVPISRRAMGRILELYGADAAAKVAANPYALIESVEGVGFVLADRIAHQAGYAPDGPARVGAGLMHVLKEQAYSSGHTCLPRALLLRAAAGLLNLSESTCDQRLRALVEAGRLVCKGDDVYSPDLHEAEARVARALRRLAAQEPEPGRADLEGLADDQRRAMQAAVRAGVFVLTGAPGTGKTHTIRRLISSFPGAAIKLAAPTGKAAKRMEELTGAPAQTIHKLLEPRPGADGGFVFTRNRSNPIEADLLVIDEMSMVDILLMAKLLDAVGPGTRLVLVGDTYQLPSVGPGNVLKDLIASGAVASVELTEIKRQDDGLIVGNCHRIKAGQDIELRNRDDADFFFLGRETPAEIVQTVLDLVSNRLPSSYDADPIRDIQVITPLRDRGDLSCKALNALFQEKLNPSPAVRGCRFKVGDKVIQTRNRYDLEILNGDIGVVQRVDPGSGALVVQFDNPGRTVELPIRDNELELAYAITCHKFQGSEAPIVVVPLHPSMGRFLLQRSWLYTAVSRAQRVCVLVGQRGVVRQAIAHNPQKHRYSNLAGQLQ
jgi:exodeoxyribonuclease V alpha subunit